ncbi:hypothetical protein QR680_010774 [Steinernema hermaphroditum]|uniref:Uncharacterized protein n=1 Tax=Steinernema hermaphroditum TaxID=289476 RepID=A0AA39IQ33_9BILA|nr:hypothetical protein QR680_010774 [Steinernema hermaphroditum]
MDSVPYEFCHDVFWTLCEYRWSCKKIAKKLTGLWKSAAEEYVKNVQMVSVTIWKNVDGEWMYSFFAGGFNGKVPKTMDELLSMDRRFVRFQDLYASEVYAEERRFQTSKKELITRLFPYLNSRPMPYSTLHIDQDCGRETGLEYLELFHHLSSYYRLNFPYLGPESEAFLATQAKNNTRFGSCALYGTWPESDEMEQLIVDLLITRNITFEHCKVTIKIAQTVLRLWIAGVCCGYSYGPAGVTKDELMEIAVPAHITTREEWYAFRGNREMYITWSKPDGSYLRCDPVCADGTVRFCDMTKSIGITDLSDSEDDDELYP